MAFLKQALLFVIIFFLFDRGLGLWLQPYYGANVEQFFQRYDAITRNKIDVDIIFTGDSQAHHGIDPLLIAKLCSCRAANLSMDGMNMITTWFALRGYLRNNVPPKVAVVQTSILQNAKFGREGEHYLLLYERLSLRDILEYMRVSRDMRFAAKELAQTYRYRSAFARLMKLGQAAPAEHQSESGFDPLVGHREGLEDTGTIMNEASSSENIPVDSVQLVYLRKALDLLRRNGVAVVMVQPAMILGRFREVPNMAEFNRAMRDIAGEYRAAYYDFNQPEYAAIQDQKYFYDGSHMNVQGAYVYGTHLWDIVRGYINMK